MEQMKQPNKDYVNQSLANQLAEQAMRVAERDAVITEQHQKIQELEKELEEIRQREIEKMDNEK